jgi:hypothetical protein
MSFGVNSVLHEEVNPQTHTQPQTAVPQLHSGNKHALYFIKVVCN